MPLTLLASVGTSLLQGNIRPLGNKPTRTPVEEQLWQACVSRRW